MNRKFLHAVVALIAIGPVSANAILLYSEVITPTTGQRSDVDPTPAPLFVSANDFIPAITGPAITGTISTVKWWGQYSPDSSSLVADDFTVNFSSTTT